MGPVNALLSVVLLTESPVPSPLPEEPPIDPSRVTPGILGFVSFLFLVVAVFSVALHAPFRWTRGQVHPY